MRVLKWVDVAGSVNQRMPDGRWKLAEGEYKPIQRELTDEEQRQCDLLTAAMVWVPNAFGGGMQQGKISGVGVVLGDDYYLSPELK